MTLVDLSPDLAQLVEEEYDIEIRDGNLLVHHVPYVNSAGEIARCILVSELSTNGERTIAPGRHEVWIVGSVPYDHEGNKIKIIVDEVSTDYGGGLVACCRLSGKPGGEMPKDYHHKISNYVLKVLGPSVRAIDPKATHKNAPPRERSKDESVFRYLDSASSRSGLSAVTSKLRLGKVSIVGMGGTGSYILDLIAKTPINNIHLFDDDLLYAHNVFRAPGAAALEEIRETPTKVEYFASMYDVLRYNIIPHPVRITEENIDELRCMDFVFLSLDAGPTKRTIIEYLQRHEISFVDCGMGVQRQGNSLRGKVRVTSGKAGHYDHLSHRISYVDINANEYDWNIQTADLNMLNAAMAVLKWKKIMGYYVDTKQELNSVYVTTSNQMLSGDITE